MPTSTSTTFSAENGASVVITHPDGTSDVYNLPQNTAITLAPQPGFGPVVKQLTSTSRTNAESQIDIDLVAHGAL